MRVSKPKQHLRPSLYHRSDLDSCEETLETVEGPSCIEAVTSSRGGGSDSFWEARLGRSLLDIGFNESFFGGEIF